MEIAKSNIVTQLSEVSQNFGDLTFRLGNSISDLSKVSDSEKSVVTEKRDKEDEVGQSFGAVISLGTTVISLVDIASTVKEDAYEFSSAADRLKYVSRFSDYELVRLNHATNELQSNAKLMAESLNKLERAVAKIQQSGKTKFISIRSLNQLIGGLGLVIIVLGKAITILNAAISAIYQD